MLRVWSQVKRLARHSEKFRSPRPMPWRICRLSWFGMLIYEGTNVRNDSDTYEHLKCQSSILPCRLIQQQFFTWILTYLLQGWLWVKTEHGDQRATAAEQSQHSHQATQPHKIQVTVHYLKAEIELGDTGNSSLPYSGNKVKTKIISKNIFSYYCENVVLNFSFRGNQILTKI